MTFSDAQLSAMIEEIRMDETYFSKHESITRRCIFRNVDDTHFDDIAVDELTERPLEFSIIGRVVRKTTFLNPEGTFRPSGVYPTKPEEVEACLNARLKVTLAPPRRDLVKARIITDDWALYRMTMTQLSKAGIVKEDKEVWTPYRDDKSAITLNHYLLSGKEVAPSEETTIDNVKNSDDKMEDRIDPSGEIESDPIDDEQEASDEQADLSGQLKRLSNITSWPSNSNWRKIADRFAHTHYVNPLPAFDDKYELIMPQAYEGKLLGAVVHARFTLSRFDIRDMRVFVCNIVELQVLKPRAREVDLRKRRALTELVMHKKKKQRLV